MFYNQTLTRFCCLPTINDALLNFRAGGSWLITDMSRKKSIFDINPTLQVAFCFASLYWSVEFRNLTMLIGT